MDDDFENQDLPPSKTRRKKDMIALQELGAELLKVNNELLDKLALTEELRRALADYKRLPNKHEARRRQMQYIGRLMRDVDGDAIRETLNQSKQSVALDRRRFQRLETTRDALIEGDEGLLERLIEEHPTIEVQHLRQLIRQASKEKSENRPPAAARKLFRYLREILED